MQTLKKFFPALVLPFSIVCHTAMSATPAQQQALASANAVRNSAGLPAFTMPASLNTAAQNHANYFVLNSAAYANGLTPHYEDANFPNGFTGVKPKDRATTAGFTSGSGFEDMAFLNNPQAAVTQLVNTVFHRVYFIHPSFTQIGYGGASDGGNRAADVFDFALGTAGDPSKIVVFPAPNATNVPPSFNVSREGPTPPPPPSGGAITGPIISVLFDRSVSSSAVITKHEIRDSLGNLLPHTLLGPSTPTYGQYLIGSYVFYADGPAAPGAVFSVHLEGTLNGAPFTKDWSFTTGTATP
jgi:hypothetical protein